MARPYTIVIDGTVYRYDEYTVFRVGVGKDRGRYGTQHDFPCAPVRAVYYYNGINIGNGYKKRLQIVQNGVATTIAREVSW